MRKRMILFLALLGFMLSCMILGPLMDRTTRENTSLNTSLSMAPSGYKALYLLLGSLQAQSVGLWQHSLMNMPDGQHRVIWMMAPGKGLFFDGEKYGERMRQLVEQGSHVIVALESRQLDQEESMKKVLSYLNRWYDLNLETRMLDGEGLNLAVDSRFATRPIRSLGYKHPEPPANKILLEGKKRLAMAFTKDKPRLAVFSDDAVGSDGEILLATRQGDPLMVRFWRGKGSITVFPNSFYFGNGQLDRGENAALAVALQESLPSTDEIWFEVYSSGFNENRDIITYLATGQGVALLVTLVLMLVALCLWMTQQPLRRRTFLATSDERFFTQEVFIGSLAGHYMATNRWNELYAKLVDQFRKELDRRYPGMSQDEQLRRMADNPFLDISYESLSAVFAKMNIGSERAFIQASRRLLAVQRKVSRYEQHASRGARAAAVTVNR